MFLGLSLAGKVPVLLNWTTGPANIDHAVRLTGLTHVITSWRLRDRLGLAIEGIEFLDVEDLRPASRAVRADPHVAGGAVAVRPRSPEGAAGPSRCRRRNPVHLGFGEGAEGRAADPPEHPRQPDGGPDRHRADLWRFDALLPADVPQLRPDGDGAAAPAGGRPRRPSPRPDGCRRAGAQGRRLPADARRRDARLHRTHPGARQAGRTGLPEADLRRGGEMPVVPLREGAAPGAGCRAGGRLRRHRVLADDRGEPARRQPPWQRGPAVAGRRGVRDGSRDQRGASRGEDGHAAGQRPQRLPRLPGG